MYYQEYLQFLENMLKKCRLQTLRMNPSAILEDQVDLGLRRLLGNRQEETFYDFFPNLKEKVLYRVADVFFCRFLFFLLPAGEVFCIGPYLNEDLSRQRIMELCERNGFPPKMAKDLEFYYMALPVIKEERDILAMVDAFLEYLWGGADRYETEELFRQNTAAFLPDFLPRSALVEGDLSPDIRAIEDRYAFENRLIEAVSKGNFRQAEQMMGRFSSLAFEARTPDQLRNIQNYCIIMNTLFRKAAEKGGVHPLFLDRTSSGIAKNIELLHSVSAAGEFMTKILRTYCRLVQNHSYEGLSPLIRSVIMAIEQDLTQDLSLAALAAERNVSHAYLSARFKKETGKPLTAFVNDRRIEAAKQLLRNSSLQIQTIAQHCGILDLHYFCRIFKAATGKTPTEYRSDIARLQ